MVGWVDSGYVELLVDSESDGVGGLVSSISISLSY